MDSQYLGFYKSRFSSGGPKGATAIVDGRKFDVFTRARKADLDDGRDVSVKIYVAYGDPNGDPLTDFQCYFKLPPNGDDEQLVGIAEADDTTTELALAPPVWLGCGALNADPTGLDEVEIVMRSTEAGFLPGGWLYLSNHFLTGQTVDDGTIAGRPIVLAGDSCELISGSWRKADHDDYDYPNGYYMGGGVVASNGSGSQEVWTRTAEKKTTGTVGAGNGTTSPTLSALSVTNGLVTGAGYQATLTCGASGGVTLSVYIDKDGYAQGDCSAGRINLSNGAWITQITWSVAPVGDVTAVYYEKNYTYDGNIMTVELEAVFTDSFDPANSYAAGVLELDSIAAAWEAEAVTSTAGTFDSSGGNVLLNPAGVEDDILTLTFSSATAFSCAGAYLGSLGSGSILADFAPINPRTGYPYITIKAAAWGGTWASGDTLVGQTRPQAQGLWLRQVIPAGSTETSRNFSLLECWGA